MSFQFPVVSSKSSSEWVGYISGCDWWISHCSLSHRKMLWMHHPAWWLGFSSDKLLVINIIPIIIYHHHHLSSGPRAFHEYWQPLAFPQAMCHGDAEVNSNRPSMQHPWGSGSQGDSKHGLALTRATMWWGLSNAPWSIMTSRWEKQKTPLAGRRGDNVLRG